MKKRTENAIRARPQRESGMAAEKKKSACISRDRKRLWFWLLVLASSIILVLPSALDTLSNIRQIGSAEAFSTRISGMTAAEIAAEKQRVRAYNRKIFRYQMIHGFFYRGQGVTDREYESLLSGKDAAGENIMGYLEIPVIRLYLPVGHGTGDGLLQYASGHMYGSSLPLGGRNTNAILTGHTGLSTARLFSDVKKLQKGDEIRIHVLDEIHRYTVTAKNEVEQGEAEAAYLQMEKGEDEVTLYTCSPYGINDHRTILRLKRTLPDVTAEESQETDTLRRLSGAAWLRLIFCAALPAVLTILALLRCRRRRGQRHLS